MTDNKDNKNKQDPFSHDLIIKDLLGNRIFAVGFLKQYLSQELVNLIEWDSVDLDNAGVEHIRQQDKDNIKNKEVSDLCFSFKFNNSDHNGAIFTHEVLKRASFKVCNKVN